MAAPKYLQRVNGVETSTSAVQSGGGVAAAGNKILSTTAAGYLDPSFLASSGLLPKYTVATLPSASSLGIGALVYCTNARVLSLNGLGNAVLQAAGAGTGGVLSSNGSTWQVDGTNIAASA